MKSAIIIDLDGTLCDIDHRKHFIDQPKKDWNQFYENMTFDLLNIWCDIIVEQIYRSGTDVLIVTGRPSNYYTQTKEWLESNFIKYTKIFMREEGDFRKDSIVKEEIYEKYIAANYNVIFAIEDRKQVVDMWRSLGITCLQCDEGNF